MDVLKTLAQIKGKVLDAAHFELLAHAYELQDQNINQLKINNEALKESNQLYKDKIERFETDLLNAKQRIEKYEQHLNKLTTNTNKLELSDVANSILILFYKCDVRSLFFIDIVQGANSSEIRTQAALDELYKAGLINCGAAQSRLKGANYCLTANGVATLSKYGR